VQRTATVAPVRCTFVIFPIAFATDVTPRCGYYPENQFYPKLCYPKLTLKYEGLFPPIAETALRVSNPQIPN